ncbi:F-box protein AUF2-like [Rhododendron vialii]|uniref:F-box protein AUF2-like n=1 Tax=Rhododendron vialii TaxID=182163 RepID=UPI00266042C5|nr:F-box protein AUF2-like [Rhododendron vialii]
MSNVHRTVGGEEEEEAENLFQRLPDEVALHIFGKLSEVKWLCRCFVVAKRFSALIPLVQTVSFETETWNSVFRNEEGDLQLQERKFSEFLTSILKLDLLLPSPRLNFPDLVFQLKQIQSLNIEFPSHLNANNDSVFQWGADFTPILKSFTFLYAASLSKTDDKNDREETENEISLNEINRGRREHVKLYCITNAVLWLGTLSCVVPTYPMLQSITITDSNNKGVKLCLGGEKLVEYRNTLEIAPTIPSENHGAWTLGKMRVGYVPILKLPSSGYVMKGATILIFKIFAFDDTALLDAFAEEKGVFSEAVVQILEKHKGRIKALFNWWII